MVEQLQGGSGVWTLPGEVLCCRASRPQSHPEQAMTEVLQERTAMILGMNPRTLRARRRWYMYMWPQKRHWALVLQPFGEPFTARLVDDFVHNAQRCFNTEVASSQFFLVYELLLDHTEPFLMLSVKPDFNPERKNVWALGLSGRLNLLELQARAREVASHYRCYSFIGANCQHFAADLAVRLGAPSRISPDDETVALAATDTALPVGVVGACVAAAAQGISGAPLAWGPALNTVAVSASAVGLVGCAALIGVAGIYKLLRDQSRQSAPAAMLAGAHMLARSASSRLLSLSNSRPVMSKSMPCLRNFEDVTDSETEDEEDVDDRWAGAKDQDWLASTFVRIASS
ncbi:unnamed protein product [Effrenium voratum]|uniref:PPPDE domain-containing protein n=1 Tax=Effrenium voratum TaxID=2562239 RepID=A0AA36J0H3_9DINO|nr:unnamed protein product [Effrenium voratum]